MTYIKIGEHNTHWTVKDGSELPCYVPDGDICDITDSGVRYKRVAGMWVHQIVDTYMGKPLTDMTKEELIEAVRVLGTAYIEHLGARRVIP